MNFWGLLFLIITQCLAGRGLLAIINLRLKLLPTICVSLMTGTMLFSLLPMVIQLFYIPITKSNIGISICVLTALLCIIPFRRYDFSVFKHIRISFPKPYQILFFLLLAAIMIPSFWRNFFFPPFARDVLSGPEALAEFAIREHKLANSVFSTNVLESAPNLLKPPFVTDLQIIYKLFVHPFGQTWLPVLVVPFLVWLYTILCEKLHPLFSYTLLLIFMTIPEMYAYTYIILWDYSNTIFFFAGCYFLLQYHQHRQYSQFITSCIMFGFATFIRLETIIFIGFLSPVLAFWAWREKAGIPKLLLNGFLFMAIPAAFYLIWVNVFVKYYLPIPLSVGGEFSLTPEISYFGWFSKINSELIFGGINLPLYGYYMFVFMTFLLIDAIFFRSFSPSARFWLYAVAVIYLGMPSLTYVTHWFNITTAKRGIFKMFPLMLLYMRDSAIMTKISAFVQNFEHPSVEAKANRPQPAHAVKQNSKQARRADKRK